MGCLLQSALLPEPGAFVHPDGRRVARENEDVDFVGEVETRASATVPFPLPSVPPPALPDVSDADLEKSRSVYDMNVMQLTRADQFHSPPQSDTEQDDVFSLSDRLVPLPMIVLAHDPVGRVEENLLPIVDPLKQDRKIGFQQGG